MSMLPSPDVPPQALPRLRLVRGESTHGDALRDRLTDLVSSRPLLEERPAHVLVVGARSAERLQMLAELRGLLPVSTPFVEAHETWEVLARATGSRMVVLTGDLGDVSAASLVRLLSRRHPRLPVVSVGGATCATAPGDVGAASR